MFIAYNIIDYGYLLIIYIINYVYKVVKVIIVYYVSKYRKTG